MRDVSGGQLKRFASGYEVVRHVAAAVLVAAALLKTHQAATDPLARAGLDGPRWFPFALAAVELLFAVWLLSNFYPVTARRASFALFGMFAAVSLYRLLSGAPDCGCFGAAAVHPVWTLALDLALLAAMWRWRPARASAWDGSPSGADSLGAAEPAMRRAKPFAPYVRPVLAPLLIAGAAIGTSRLFSPRPLSALPLFVQPELLTVQPSPKFSCQAREGEVVTAAFMVRNVTREPVKLLGAASSCGCTVVTDDFPIELAPEGLATVHVRVNVGQPDPGGRFVKAASLFVNREGAVPPLVVEITVLGRSE